LTIIPKSKSSSAPRRFTSSKARSVSRQL
jgi:hypothetical protein